MTAFPMEPDFEREKRFGRPMIVPEYGGNPTPYTRCTTYVGCLEDTFNLSQWQQRMVARGLALRNDLLLAVASTPDSDKRRLDELTQEARDAAGASSKATIGTALHEMSELVDRGESIEHLPPNVKRSLQAYREGTSELTVLGIERKLVLDDLKIAGTCDRIVDFEGKRYIADIKTGSVDFGGLKIAMQLAVYANSRLYDVKTHQRSKLPDVDRKRAIVIHLPSDPAPDEAPCRLLWADIEQGWQAVQTATTVREWRTKSRRMLTQITSVSPMLPEPEPVEQTQSTAQPREATPRDVLNAVASAASTDELASLWRAHRAIWNPELTQLAAARKALLAGELVK